MMSEGLCYTPAENLVTRKIAGETIIVPLSRGVGEMGSIFTLNESGTVIWEMLRSETSPSTIVEAICGEYEVTRAQAEEDVADFLRSLYGAGLLFCSTPQRIESGNLQLR